MLLKIVKHFLDPIAFVLGIVLGLLLPQFYDTYKAIGSIYINLLKLLALPVLMCMVFGTLSRPSQKSRLLPQVLLVFICMFAATFILTALMSVLVRPGIRSSIPNQEWGGEIVPFSIASFISKIFPANLFAAMSSGDFLPCILIAAAFGYAARILGTNVLKECVSDIEKIALKLLSYVMRLTPAGVFFLMAAAASADGTSVIRSGLKYVLFAWVFSFLALVIVMLIPVCLIRKISPKTYFLKIRKTIINAISTCSSAATLPITIETCRKEFSIDEDICSITAPLGCTIHMCGGAVSFCLLAFFTFQMEKMPISFALFLLMLFAAEVINMAAPGIPGGGIVIGASYLSLLGAPLTIMGMYSGIYRFLDMAYTTLNVLGDITANVIIQHIRQKRVR